MTGLSQGAVVGMESATQAAKRQDHSTPRPAGGSVVTLRASAVSDFLDCPARAEARHLLHKRMPMRSRALLGIAVHASTALYDQSALDGAGITSDEAAGAAVDAINKPSDDMDWEGEEGPKEIESIAVALHGRYCSEIAPKQDYAAVEVKCERLEISDLGLALTGTTDRVRKTGEGYAISDLKTGKSAVSADGHVETKGHAFQLGIYELLAQAASGLDITGPAQVIGMTTGKTERGQRVGLGEIKETRSVLLGEEDSPGVLQVISGMIHAGSFVGNPRSMLCNVKYCPIYAQCKFRR